jgi:hypothetical protein
MERRREEGEVRVWSASGRELHNCPFIKLK